LRQEDFEFTVSDEGIASDNRQVERVMFSDHVERAPNQFVSFEIGQATQIRGSETRVFVGVASGTTQRAFTRDFDGQ
jgi:hypothetical protein